MPANRVEAFFKNPFADLAAAQTAPLKIQRALIGRVPETRHGWLVALGLYAFMAFYAIGPGVCVWLALSELMPTRIRSVGMSIALVINQLVSTTLAVLFSAHRQQIWLFHDVLPLRGLYRHLSPDRNLPAPRDQGQDLGGD